ncbi:DNA adenine methylase [Pseudomethylobacillus aquaticus]|uniref:DNA adenine methylase n=1 Tax=Pseudomethylobacillus aquaticus TaxID=2676064 RepID=UPI00139052A5|nr:DNA adenine methylase [Pseudomethylobacillus aquaticus]
MTSIDYREQVEQQADLFRPIYYLGCKNSFTSAIQAAIDDVDPSGGRLLDLFAGTGSVGAALGCRREVTTVDVQEYSRVLCSAVLSPSALSQAEITNIVARAASNETTKQVLWCLQPLLDHERECIREAIMGDFSELVELLESPPLAVHSIPEFAAPSTRLGDAAHEAIHRLHGKGLWQSAETTVSRYFGGLYFSFIQAAMLDALLSVANSSDEQCRDTLTAAALGTASQLVNTVGKQFAQPIQPKNKSGAVKPGLVKVVQRDRSLDTLQLYRTWLDRYARLPSARGKSQAIRQDYLAAIGQNASNCTVAYADPPYTRDHYSRFYHVLETMCLRDNPAITKVMKDSKRVPSRGAYREDRHQSAFCIRSAAPAAFDALFKATREHDLPLVLSYSPHETGDGTHPRVVSMNQIVELAHAHYDRVEVCTVDGVTHNKLNSSELTLKTRDQAEILLKCFR